MKKKPITESEKWTNKALIVKVRAKLGWKFAELIFQAYGYAEKPINQNQIKKEIYNLYWKGELTEVVKDFCIDVLAGRVQSVWRKDKSECHPIEKEFQDKEKDDERERGSGVERQLPPHQDKEEPDDGGL